MIVRAYHFTDVPPAEWPWPNFKPIEIASHGDGSIAIESDAMDTLQALRLSLGRPMRINSAYRDPIHNARVGGAPRSAHKLGLAFDLHIGTLNRHLLHEIASEVGFRGIGFYRSFLHVDISRRRQWWGRGGKEAWK